MWGVIRLICIQLFQLLCLWGFFVSGEVLYDFSFRSRVIIIVLVFLVIVQIILNYERGYIFKIVLFIKFGGDWLYSKIFGIRLDFLFFRILLFNFFFICFEFFFFSYNYGFVLSFCSIVWCYKFVTRIIVFVLVYILIFIYKIGFLVVFFIGLI